MIHTQNKLFFLLFLWDCSKLTCKKFSKIFYSQFYWKKIFWDFFGKFEKKFLPKKKKETEQFFQENCWVLIKYVFFSLRNNQKKVQNFFNDIDCKKFSKIFNSQFHWKNNFENFSENLKKTFFPPKRKDTEQFFQENLTWLFVGFWLNNFPILFWYHKIHIFFLLRNNQKEVYDVTFTVILNYIKEISIITRKSVVISVIFHTEICKTL